MNLVTSVKYMELTTRTCHLDIPPELSLHIATWRVSGHNPNLSSPFCNAEANLCSGLPNELSKEITIV